MTRSVQQALVQRTKTDFSYAGIIDPGRLGSVVDAMTKSVAEIESGMTSTKGVFQSSQAMADAVTNAHQTAQTLLAAMKTNVEDVQDGLFAKGHFACEMIDEAVIDNFYARDLRPGVTAVRVYLVEQLGEQQVDTLVMEDEDRYLGRKAAMAIEKANLLRLNAQRGLVDGRLSASARSMQALREDINKAGHVPQTNANQFRSSASTLYALSCVPVLGLVPALMLRSKIETFAPAFQSTNQVYRQLGSEILVKNEKMRKVNTMMGINYVTGMVLSQAGKRLQSYMVPPRDGQQSRT